MVKLLFFDPVPTSQAMSSRPHSRLQAVYCCVQIYLALIFVLAPSALIFLSISLFVVSLALAYLSFAFVPYFRVWVNQFLCAFAALTLFANIFQFSFVMNHFTAGDLAVDGFFCAPSGSDSPSSLLLPASPGPSLANETSDIVLSFPILAVPVFFAGWKICYALTVKYYQLPNGSLQRFAHFLSMLGVHCTPLLSAAAPSAPFVRSPRSTIAKLLERRPSFAAAFAAENNMPLIASSSAVNISTASSATSQMSSSSATPSITFSLELPSRRTLRQTLCFLRPIGATRRTEVHLLLADFLSSNSRHQRDVVPQSSL